MMKYVVLISTMICLTYAQRPPYAGTSHRYPVVFPQYVEAIPAASEAAGNIGNRIDTENGNPTTIRVPIDLPVDALGDIDLVNRIKTWPREKQPFWFINWQQIQAHRGDSANIAPVTQQSQQQ
ncbi:serine/threonine-protein kinase HRK1-like [Vespula squamosa]|uniref:Serine/threonine-protein kinase HRK1-like n=1 Tax=Vespula squamosa TaxID=30214 RepID=A0ABD2BH60_VESSQ